MIRRRRRSLLAIALLPLIALLLGLGIWQIERRAWKLALIERVERGLAAAPVPAPGPADWPGIGTDATYRRVRVSGQYLSCRTHLSQAVTELGPGKWVMTPLRSDRGFVVFVNRGFLPEGKHLPPCGQDLQSVIAVTGLLRLNEPGGGFLRKNDPAASRWYSRDVQAMGAGLKPLAPYFIDADRAGPGWPRGGMTIVRFSNSHLVYALTWFSLAALTAWFAWWAWRGGADA
ncbi:SURF1 family protein [Sphingomonas sp. HT-1]|uniref:SURF1 family protein n=1 Tax=unclassified Sphingomonas TaxID=196159 RepID=UPI00030B951D|nr:SURF1 family cytochrome oxidase biogenesis protein [Sphingomonas sp. WG]KTF67252.1 Surfeit locus 1 family protein [Sphingomonas sp. WG]